MVSVAYCPPSAESAVVSDMTSFLRGPRTAAALFLASGLSFGALPVRSPALKSEHSLDDVAFGALNMMFGVVAIVAMRAVTPLIRRVGAPRVARVAVVVLPITLAAVGSAPGTIAYGAALLVVAAANGVLDVAMNATAVEAERQAGRPILSRCHAGWSIGATIATIGGTASIAAGVPTWVHLLVVAVIGVPLGLLAGQGTRSIPPSDAESAGTARVNWTSAIVRLSLIGTVLMIAEGAALGWSGVLIHEVRGASLGTAAVATASFTISQTAARLIGDRMRARWGDASLFRVGAIVAAAGMGLAVIVPDAVVDIVGFALFGLGSAALIPIVYAETGRRDPGGPAVPRLTAFLYAGVLAGPGAIGFAAGAIGLTWAIGGVPVLLAAASGLFPRRHREAPRPIPTGGA